MSDTDPGFQAALDEATKGAAEGGVPIGACLVDKNGQILGQGHNMRVQKSSATLHVRFFTASFLGSFGNQVLCSSNGDVVAISVLEGPQTDTS